MNAIEWTAPKFHDVAFATDAERAAVAVLPSGERQRMVENLLYEYPAFTKTMKFVKRFRHPVDGGTHGRGCCAGVLGESRSGKSYVLRRYLEENPPVAAEDGESFPVVYLEARDDWTPHHFAEQLFMATGAKAVPKVKTPALISSCQRRIVNARTELVIIDDAHFLLLERHGRSLSLFKSFIKAIADLRTCNVLLAGLPHLHGFVASNEQLFFRGGFPKCDVVPLSWKLKEEQNQFRLLLNGIDERLPFARKSNLAHPDWAVDFHRLSGGMIGRIMNVIQARHTKPSTMTQPAFRTFTFRKQPTCAVCLATLIAISAMGTEVGRDLSRRLGRPAVLALESGAVPG